MTVPPSDRITNSVQDGGPSPLVHDEESGTFLLRSQVIRSQRIIVDRSESILQNGIEDLLCGRSCVMIVDCRVLELHPDLAVKYAGQENLLAIPFDESAKTLQTVELVLKFASERELERRGVLVAIGGGSCMDVVGLAASLFRRGAPHFKIPTTLMGMVDAGIATKNGVNFHGAKNRVGTFHPPEVTLVAPFLLKTLPIRHLANGLAECVKLAVVGDSALFKTLEEAAEISMVELARDGAEVLSSIINRSIATMLQCLSENLYEETSLERSVDFGHTISPNLEITASGTLLHGEAVAVDIAFHTVLAHQIGYMDKAEEACILAMLRHYNLPVWNPCINVEFVRTAYRSSIAHRGGRLNLPIPTKIGECVFIGGDEISDDSIARAIDRVSRLAAK